ncbi:hypothetical protein [Nocardia sp. SYP-A9097]|uniref:hypothetical protein n=1 Tax=Nocardia sp. SYP-A9097 TaxID=2663237 RepID=UPI001E2F155B|nr:hypothetical protein [Nocardia sp. SYP-A9097]
MIVPPDQEAPAGEYFVHQATGLDVMFGFRTLVPDPEKAQRLVDQVRIRPLHGDAPANRLISPDNRPWTGDQPRGLDYWARLHEIYQRAIVDERDRFYLPCCDSSVSSRVSRSRPMPARRRS